MAELTFLFRLLVISQTAHKWPGAQTLTCAVLRRACVPAQALDSPVLTAWVRSAFGATLGGATSWRSGCGRREPLASNPERSDGETDGSCQSSRTLTSPHHWSGVTWNEYTWNKAPVAWAAADSLVYSSLSCFGTVNYTCVTGLNREKLLRGRTT